MSIWDQAVGFLLAIGVLVAVHEFGHYWVAKKLGFKVLRFSIGFGKPLWTRIGKDADKTEYCISALPLGGYVNLLNERDGEVDPADLPRAFGRRPILHRIAVLLAGPGMNFLFAIVLYAALAMIGTDAVKPVIGMVQDGSPAALAGLRQGDEVIRVGDREVGDTEELQIALIRRFSDDGLLPLRVRRDGGERTVTIRVEGERRALTEPGRLLPGLGFDLASWISDVKVDKVPADSAGAKAGLQAGDRLIAVDGRSVANMQAFQAAVQRAAGSDISIEIERAGRRMSLAATVPAVTEDGKRIGRLGIMLAEGTRSWPPGVRITRRAGPLDALGEGVVKTWEMSAMTVQMLWRVVTGQVSAKNISGVVSIAEFAGMSVMLGFTAFLSFLAIISVSLGVLNLAPVPLLDGGQVVYQVVEAVKGSPLSERAQIFGQQVGIALIVLLMSLAFYNDISRHLN
jgi:regulator of sigma E protease